MQPFTYLRADSLDQADAGVATGVGQDDLAGAIGRVVIHEERFPGKTSERGIKPGDQFRYIVSFVEGGQHYGEIQPRTGG